jgi:uncharacterized alkaline shock family protein YloU
MTLVRENGHGTITIAESVLLQVVTRAAEAVPGVRVRRKRSVDVESRVVRLELTARRGEPLVPLAKRVQEEVAAALATMCGLEPSRVDVAIEDVEDGGE